MRAWVRVACLVLAAGLAGCGGLKSGPASPLPDDAAALDSLAVNYAPGRVNDCLATPLQAQRACRDTIVQALMVGIDLRYAQFELGMLDANRYGNFGATVAAIGLTTAGAVSGGGLARALAAAAAGVTGSREAFNREVLVEHTVLALQSAMQARRNEVSVRIREGLRRDAEDYPLGVALADIYAYYRAGTLPGALVGVSESVSARAQDARRQVNETIVSHDMLPAPAPPQPVPTAPPPSRITPRVAEPVPPGVDRGPEREAMRAWITGGANLTERNARRAAILREAASLGYDEAGRDVAFFLDSRRPEVVAMKPVVVRRLRIPMGG